ncbi:ferritin-like domain-containing protein [Streptomyces chartreusis]|uniref:ferritin-like domain-containing protein n=1 Tax=Streptomyces chartreusis TaxID=1969 RepID=UPI00363F2840
MTSSDHGVPRPGRSPAARASGRGRSPGETPAHAFTTGVADSPAAAVTDKDKRALVSAVECTFDNLFTREYHQGERGEIDALYRKAKAKQWDVDLDIDWSVGGQIDRARDPGNPLNRYHVPSEGVFARLNAGQRADLGHAGAAWTISQFLHTEQGALACAAKLVQASPWLDAKFYASTQVMDEARHMEVYARYIREKLEWEFPINPHLSGLIDDVVRDARWDFTYLGMQVVIEGLALAAFSLQYKLSPDPLLRQITRYVMADEARHVAFGVLSLRETYAELTSAEIRERQEFCFEAVLSMRNRYLSEEVWEELGLPVRECAGIVQHSPVHAEFRRALFSAIVPNLKRLGLLDAGDGWLRARFGELGVLGYEHLEDTSVAYERMDLDHAPWDVVQYQHY